MNSLLRSVTDSPCCEVKQCESPSILDNMKRRKVELESKLQLVNDCIKALEENPAINKVLELIARAR